MNGADGNDDPGWPSPSAMFAGTFTSPLYQDFADEFAPFGTDEGFDAMAALIQSRPSPGLTLHNALEQLHGQDTLDLLLQQEPDAMAELDPVLIGLAFGLIWLTGTLDEHGRLTALAALQRQIDRYGPQPTLQQLRRDLTSWQSANQAP